MIDELLEAYNHTHRHAQKDHKCCECWGWILKGETYHYHSGVCDGRGQSYKICNDCERLRAEVNKTVTDPYEGMAFEGLQEAVRDTGDASLAERFKEIQTRRRRSNAP